MKLLNFVCISIILLSAAACNVMGERVKGNGNVITENRDIKNVSRIDLVGDIDVVLTEGETMVKVEGDENLLRHIITEDNDGWLKIRTRDDVNLSSKHNLVVHVSTPKITDLKVTGSGDLTSNSKFSTEDDMSLSVTGSGNMTIPLHAPRVSASITGSGNINASGETRDVKVSIAGSGDFNGEELKSENANISIAGSGNVDIYADKILKAKIMGSGDIHYKGNATVDKNVMGSGSIARAQ